MRLKAQADTIRAPKIAAEPETMDFTKRLDGEYKSPGGMRSPDRGASFLGIRIEVLPISGTVILRDGLAVFANGACNMSLKSLTLQRI
jgi:hypothetical protein